MTITINENPLIIEVARSTEEQRVGLMNRKRLPKDHGMLFVYDADRRLSFWMKNTTIPLSIAFVSADGYIREIYDMNPLSLREVVSIRAVRYALEVNQGLFSELGIKPGDQIIFPEDF